MLPTAKEFLEKNCDYILPNDLRSDIEEAMINYTKLHREAIIKEIAEDYLYYLEGDEGSERLDKKKFFKEIYPLTNIK